MTSGKNRLYEYPGCNGGKIHSEEWIKLAQEPHCFWPSWTNEIPNHLIQFQFCFTFLATNSFLAYKIIIPTSLVDVRMEWETVSKVAAAQCLGHGENLLVAIRVTSFCPRGQEASLVQEASLKQLMSTDSQGIKITAPEIKQTQVGRKFYKALCHLQIPPLVSINVYWVVLNTCFVQSPVLTMECVHYVESSMHSAGKETTWKCAHMHSDSKYELPLFKVLQARKLVETKSKIVITRRWDVGSIGKTDF